MYTTFYQKSMRTTFYNQCFMNTTFYNKVFRIHGNEHLYSQWSMNTDILHPAVHGYENFTSSGSWKLGFYIRWCKRVFYIQFCMNMSIFYPVVHEYRHYISSGPWIRIFYIQWSRIHFLYSQCSIHTCILHSIIHNNEHLHWPINTNMFHPMLHEYRDFRSSDL